MKDELTRIEQKIDKLDGKLDDYQLAIEHRVTVLETKAGIWGTIGGFLSGILASFVMKH